MVGAARRERGLVKGILDGDEGVLADPVLEALPTSGKALIRKQTTSYEFTLKDVNETQKLKFKKLKLIKKSEP